MNEQVLVRYRNLRRAPVTLGALLFGCTGAGSAANVWGSPAADLALVSAGTLVLPAAAVGNSVVVQNCNNAGNDSLRAAVANAPTGAVIDLRQLPCTKITLTTGQITVAQDDLILLGPGADQLTIDGGFGANHDNRIFQHTGTGILELSKLTLTDAKYRPANHNATGGCISSAGTVSLSEAIVSECFADAQGNFSALGGAIYAKGVILTHSTVTGNFSSASSTGRNEGGGIFSAGGLTARYSTISANSAVGNYGYAGGVKIVSGDVYLLGSTLSANSGGAYGAMQIQNPGATASTTQILNTTISSNHATYAVGGVGVANSAITVANSTIALNTSNVDFNGSGLRTLGYHAVLLQDSIIANNSAGGFDSDIEAGAGASIPVAGNNNLITQHVGQVPADTNNACPLIGPLGDYGGETQTHALFAGSPAIGAGGNVAKLFSYDQRGPGYLRTVGTIDVGAFESQGVALDHIFSNEFEGRCR